MGYQVEDLGKNMVKLTITCAAADFEEACKKAFQKNKDKLNIQGFRKGKAPYAIVTKMYGKSMFYEDAANILIPEAYDEAAKNCGIEIVSRPEIDVTEIGEGKDFVFTATVAKKPEVTLGEYKGVTVDKIEISVSDEEIEEELKKTQEQNAREINIEDRPVQDGDTAVIDYEGFCDGVAFAGGKGENHPLVIGSHSFIDGFEDQLIGKSIGEECDVNVTFPEQYHAEELAGKPAVFKCKVNAIKAKELPELDDEFASEVSEFDTLAEYKEDIKKNLTEKKEKEAKTKKEDQAVEKAVANATMEVPEAMIQSTQEQMAEDFAYRLQSQGLKLEQYFQFTGLNQKTFLEQMKPQAEKRINTRLVLEAIVKAENITVSDEEIEEELKKMSEQYHMEIDKIKEYMGEENLKNMTLDLACGKAVTLVADSAVEA
ncbi:MAG: trigger factor [Lachnospiraceae bacterium]|jgi:trigger factor|nr:trigger factor [Lachnospiraceae bacterium]